MSWHIKGLEVHVHFNPIKIHILTHPLWGQRNFLFFHYLCFSILEEAEHWMWQERLSWKWLRESQTLSCQGNAFPNKKRWNGVVRFIRPKTKLKAANSLRCRREGSCGMMFVKCGKCSMLLCVSKNKNLISRVLTYFQFPTFTHLEDCWMILN